MGDGEGRPHKSSVIWDAPLRIWHWAFGACVAFSLYSGLAGDFALTTWHMRSGLAILGLLVFRIGWGLWGGDYARFGHYRTTPRAFLDHFRRRGERRAHTAPGIVLVALLLALVALQAVAGLFTTDDIFNDGPLRGFAADALADAANWIHHRLGWLILGLVGVHLAAHLVYAAMRDPTPLAMFTGRKSIEAPRVRNYWRRAALTAALGAAVALAVANARALFG